MDDDLATVADAVAEALAATSRPRSRRMAD